jgi:hypothetical protein
MKKQAKIREKGRPSLQAEPFTEDEQIAFDQIIYQLKIINILIDALVDREKWLKKPTEYRQGYDKTSVDEVIADTKQEIQNLKRDVFSRFIPQNKAVSKLATISASLLDKYGYLPEDAFRAPGVSKKVRAIVVLFLRKAWNGKGKRDDCFYHALRYLRKETHRNNICQDSKVMKAAIDRDDAEKQGCDAYRIAEIKSDFAATFKEAAANYLRNKLENVKCERGSRRYDRCICFVADEWRISPSALEKEVLSYIKSSHRR